MGKDGKAEMAEILINTEIENDGNDRKLELLLNIREIRKDV